MKITLALTIGLFLSSAYAGLTSNYRGKFYSSINLHDCNNEYEKIVKRVEAHEGFKVILGGCTYTSDEDVQLVFTYTYPISGSIDRLNRKFESETQCNYFEANAFDILKKANMQYITSYCQGSELIADYMDIGPDVLRGIPANLSFDTKESCNNYMSDIRVQLAKNDIKTLFETCRKVVFNSNGRHEIYVPEFNMGMNYQKQVEFLEGKKLLSSQDCTLESQALSPRFEKESLSLIKTLCVSSRWGGEKRELLIYVSTEKSPYVRELEGIASLDKARCELNLLDTIKNLENLGHKELYSFCKMNNRGLYNPIIHYTEKKEIYL